VWSLFGAIIVALVIADLWSNSSVTNSLITAGTTESGLIANKPS
jgi:hypothetical protein